MSTLSLFDFYICEARGENRGLRHDFLVILEFLVGFVFNVLQFLHVYLTRLDNALGTAHV